MKTAKITQVDDVLYVELPDGHRLRRKDGTWQMLSSKGNWFENGYIYDLCARKQVEDYEYCLRPYSYEEGPALPKGRRKFEDIGDFIRRVQATELRRDCRDIFGPVNLRYEYKPQIDTARLRRNSEWLSKHLAAP